MYKIKWQLFPTVLLSMNMLSVQNSESMEEKADSKSATPIVGSLYDDSMEQAAQNCKRGLELAEKGDINEAWRLFILAETKGYEPATVYLDELLKNNGDHFLLHEILRQKAKEPRLILYSYQPSNAYPPVMNYECDTPAKPAGSNQSHAKKPGGLKKSSNYQKHVHFTTG